MIHMCFSLAELRSKKAVSLQDKGSEPEWNETFVFTISEGTSELVLKIMDRDTLTDDDYLGKASIPLEPLFIEGNLPATAYSVVKDEEYRGEIRVGLSFTPEDRRSRALDAEEEGYGGWKESAYTD
ncbi:16 KDA PHLOEM PROTEIN 2 [Salix purpurea]|uniref:16 kDa PHLOEM PROTEIN 2 n=1 Tax=Salix purpurea TaxID=77065 RepID=A0A9Q0SQB6_SALPP|nr:16 KDA PHLOEM PROTEIN 2 [Salix purpurea]